MSDTEGKNGKETEPKKKTKIILDFKTTNDGRPAFDYTSDIVKTVKDEVSESNYYFKPQYSNTINRYGEQNDAENNCDSLLLRVRKSKNGYYELINPIVKIDITDVDNLEKLNKKMWLVMKSNNDAIKYENENEPYYLCEKDIIKLCQTKFEIIKLNINKAEINKDSKDSNLMDQIREVNKKFGSVLNIPLKKLYQKKVTEEKKDKTNTKQEKENKMENGVVKLNNCEFCKGNLNEEKNPLIKICKCNFNKHYSCLKKEILGNEREKITIENISDRIIKYKIEKFFCNICNEPYPLYFKTEQNQEMTLCVFDEFVPDKDKDYMIFESLADSDQKNNEKIILVIILNNGNEKEDKEKELFIGSNYLNYFNQGVSGEHAIFEYDKKEGKVSVINKGIYGTSILIKNNVKLKPGQKIYFQIDKTYIRAEVKEDENKIETEPKKEDKGKVEVKKKN